MGLASVLSNERDETGGGELNVSNNIATRFINKRVRKLREKGDQTYKDSRLEIQVTVRQLGNTDSGLNRATCAPNGTTRGSFSLVRSIKSKSFTRSITDRNYLYKILTRRDSQYAIPP